jgi:hypothetical protein
MQGKAQDSGLMAQSPSLELLHSLRADMVYDLVIEVQLRRSKGDDEQGTGTRIGTCPLKSLY